MSVEHLTSTNFKEKALDATGPVLVDFFADWCGPCKALAPVIEELATDFSGKAGVYKLNVDEAGDIAQQYGVMSIPTIICFKGGQEVSRTMGAQPKEALASQLDQLLG